MRTFKLNKQVYQILFSWFMSNDENKPPLSNIGQELNLSAREVQMYCFVIENRDKLNLHTDDELANALVKAKDETQRYMDKNRILRKEHRESARLPNALMEMNSEMIKLLEKNSIAVEVCESSSDLNISNVPRAGIVQCSDWHLNELINIPGLNTFNFDKASKMLKKLGSYTIFKFNSFNIKHILVVLTGDLLNSDRRIDEKLNMATNRTKAMFIGVELLTSLLQHLASAGFQVHVLYVSGNESRIQDEIGYSQIMMTDNYDYSICKMVQYLTLKDKRITFCEQDDYVSQVFKIAGQVGLATHGSDNVLSGGNVEKGVIQLCGKYSARGIDINHVLFGHLHYTRNGDHFSRNASLPGANAYSDTALGLITKSAQNVHVVTPHMWLTERVDLTNVDDVSEGYPYTKELEAYFPKSALKTRTGRTIMEIRI